MEHEYELEREPRSILQVPQIISLVHESDAAGREHHDEKQQHESVKSAEKTQAQRVGREIAEICPAYARLRSRSQ